MVNILLEGYDIDAPWLYGALRPYIRPSDRVAVVAFSFRDNRVKSPEDWDRLYAKEKGMPPAARFLSRERNRGKSAAGVRPCTPGAQGAEAKGA